MRDGVTKNDVPGAAATFPATTSSPHNRAVALKISLLDCTVSTPEVATASPVSIKAPSQLLALFVLSKSLM